jgi:putative methyltransferase (TIGR04325 family)
LAHDWLPPAIAHWLRARLGRPIRFEGDFENWEAAALQCTGYDADDILAKVLASTNKVKNGEAAFERDSVLFEGIEYVWPVLTGLLWAAARNGGRLSVLDFGGALGSTYFQNRRFLRALPEVNWNVVEQANFVEAGLAGIQDEQLRFYGSIEQCVDENRPNVVLLSSVLQYLKSPIDVLKRLSCAGADTLIIDRTPFSKQGGEKLMIQRVPASIYAASYPMRVFSQPEFMSLLDADWSLIASNLSLDGLAQSTSGFKFSFRGMLFESRP